MATYKVMIVRERSYTEETTINVEADSEDDAGEAAIGIVNGDEDDGVLEWTRDDLEDGVEDVRVEFSTLVKE